MPEPSNRERDLVLAPNEFAYIADQTKGHIVVYVGPTKTSLANTDQPVVFNELTKRFERCLLEQAISVFSTAPEGWYLVLKNPAKEGQPKSFGPNNLPELHIGRKVNIPGPVSFSNWPGQMVRVVKGHHLKTNHYLLVRVYDEEAAKANWAKAVIKPQTATGGDVTVAGGEVKEARLEEVPELTMGKLLIIQGTQVSFYIPPTGIEVVRDQQDNYVREAVTLERLEYCILLDEDGNKRFIQGPAVVFPKPTERFVERHGSRKFKAIELNEISGIYVKVIAPYTEAGRTYKVGEEIFITGKDQMIYFPRPEHAIIKYGEQEIHYAVAIPAGEGRYVLNRLTGKIDLQHGPRMFLPNPRDEVILRRVLDPKECRLWFPGNAEALEYNVKLKQLVKGDDKGQLADQVVKKKLQRHEQALDQEVITLSFEERASTALVSDDFTRSQTFTAPRTITLDTKYEGAVAIDVWTGYAVLVVGRVGQRKVVVGPKTCLLEYDEGLEAMTLSTGTPKTDENQIKTAYLRVLHNKVSDVVLAESLDLCRVAVRLSYRVNFEGEPETWFNVENYVKFLTDHMRSHLRNAIKKINIEEFYADAITVVRDTVLGKAAEGEKRPGRLFPENNMRIYDVEILDCTIGDEVIEKMVIGAQHSVVKQNLELSGERRRLDFIQKTEDIKRQILEAQAATRSQQMQIQTEEAKQQVILNLAQLETEIQSRKRNLQAKETEQGFLDKIDLAERSRRQENQSLETAFAQAQLNMQIEEWKAEADSVVNKAKAVTPDLIAAIQAFSDRALAEKLAESMAPLAILGGTSIADVFAKLIKGTALEMSLKQGVQPPVKR